MSSPGIPRVGQHTCVYAKCAKGVCLLKDQKHISMTHTHTHTKKGGDLNNMCAQREHIVHMLLCVHRAKGGHVACYQASLFPQRTKRGRQLAEWARQQRLRIWLNLSQMVADMILTVGTIAE